MDVSGAIWRRRRLGPFEDGQEAAPLVTNALFMDKARQCIHAGLDHGRGRAELAHQREGQVTLPQIRETGGIPGQGGI